MGKWGDAIEDLLNRMTNAGEVAALRGHVSSLYEQAQAVDNELLTLKTKIQQIEGQHSETVAKLKEQKTKIETENLQLKAQIQAMQGGAVELSDTDKQLMRFLFEKGGYVSELEMRTAFRLSESMVEYHLDRIASAGFMADNPMISRNRNAGLSYSLNKKGRAFVVGHILPR